MGLMIQTIRPGRELAAKVTHLRQKWSKLSNKSRENIIKEVLGDGSKQPASKSRTNGQKR